MRSMGICARSIQSQVLHPCFGVYVVNLITIARNTSKYLRIDNRRQGVLCGIRLSSVATDCTLTCYISNERSYFSLSNHIIDILNCPVSKKL